MKKYTIKEFRKDYPNDDACLDKLFQIRYKNLVCPKCENDKPFVRVKDRRSYYCTCCGFQIYPTQGTVFEKTTTSLTDWFHAIYLQTTTRNGVSAKELERNFDICYKTALRMAHQIKKLMSDKELPKLFGEIEVDETYMGAQARFYSNSKKKKVEKANVTKSNHYGKTQIFGILERGAGGKVYTEVMPTVTQARAEKAMLDIIHPDSKISTDNSQVYARIDHLFIHERVNHQEREWAVDGYHTNTIESFWNQVKRTIKGTHIHVSTKHLQKYLNEIAFRWEHRHNQAEMFELILKRVA